MAANLSLALVAFSMARTYVEQAQLLAESEWQRNQCFPEFSESDLLREAAWVILCTGFRESIVRRVFDHISLSFCDWESSSKIVASSTMCIFAAKASFRNERKLNAIIRLAREVDNIGFGTLKERILSAPIEELNKLPYIGPITAWHLAKNLGFDVAKPDRHLVRLCTWLGYDDVHEMCGDVASSTGTKASVVDIIFWRFMADHATSRSASAIRRELEQIAHLELA